ncbi:MAG: cyclic nucleotide-binding domain-containing protein [Wenzhouxiangellaceae bacterium]
MCLPASLDRVDQHKLFSIFSSSPVPKDGFAYLENAPFQHLYLIRKGAVKTWSSNPNGDMQILGFHLPGELLGLDGVADSRHRCNAQALVESQLCRIPYARLDTLASEFPSLRMRLMNIIGREFLLEQEHIVMMSARPAIERLALFLQTLLRRVEITVGPQRILTLDMARWEIANFLAVASETVSRLLAELQKTKVIRINRRDIEILDLARLIEISGQDVGELPCFKEARRG